MNESPGVPVACPDLKAFCAARPTPEEVGARLAKLGFHLVFQMREQRDHHLLLPPLPAQYHYRDEVGTEVIYLAGCDVPMHENGGSAFPPHKSRFWLSCGAKREPFQIARATLALSWGFTWQTVGETEEDDDSDDDELITLTQEVA